AAPPAAGKIDPMAKMQAADAQTQKGQYKEALDEYLWCFDHGQENSPDFHGVRLSFLLGRISALGKAYAPALDALKTRRDAAREMLVSGKGGFETASDFASLSRELNDHGAILSVYDKLRTQGDPAADARAVLLDDVLEDLVAAKRYGDILAD